MAFKIKDLMVSILPLGNNPPCHPPTRLIVYPYPTPPYAYNPPCDPPTRRVEYPYPAPPYAYNPLCHPPTRYVEYPYPPPCHPPTWLCLPTVPPDDPTATFQALSILKEQLKQQLAEVEKQQAAIEDCLLPKTIEEVDKLSEKLTEALKELRERRAELSREV